MTVKLRLARQGRIHSPCYKIVASVATSPRDGKFLEKVGTYNPLLDHSNENRVTIKKDRVEYWLKTGAQPTKKVLKILNGVDVELPEKIKKSYDKMVKNYKTRPAKKSSNS